MASESDRSTLTPERTAELIGVAKAVIKQNNHSLQNTYWDVLHEMFAAMMEAPDDSDLHAVARRAFNRFFRKQGQRRANRSLDFYGSDFDRFTPEGQVLESLDIAMRRLHIEASPSAEDQALARIEPEGRFTSITAEQAMTLLDPNLRDFLLEVIEDGVNAYTAGRKRGMSINSVTRILQQAGLTETGRFRSTTQGRSGPRVTPGLAGVSFAEVTKDRKRHRSAA